MSQQRQEAQTEIDQLHIDILALRHALQTIFDLYKKRAFHSPEELEVLSYQMHHVAEIALATRYEL